MYQLGERRGSRRAKAGAMIVGLAALVAAGCSAAPSHPDPAHTLPAHLSGQQVAPALVQCLINHHLVPASALAADQDAKPPGDSSTWLRDGKVVANLRFGDWFSDAGGNVVVRGQQIAAWTIAIEMNPRKWPASLCGPWRG